MDFSETYFNKILKDVFIEDVELYFKDGRKKESLTIEYKSWNPNSERAKNLEAIYRTITAFLNSEGGILIWGAPKEITVDVINTKGKTIRESISKGDLTFIDELIEHDTFINLISGSIHPMPKGITLSRLEKGKGYIYLFEIQPSIAKPHQFDYQYPIRMDGKTQAAPHYLIQALMNQVSFPNIEGYIKPIRVHADAGAKNIFLTIDILIFNFSKLQNEENVFFKIESHCGRPSDLYGNGGYASYTIPILSYGMPFIKRIRVDYDYNNLQKNRNCDTLILSFVGKLTPAKNSTYELNVLDGLSCHENDCNCTITKKDENIILSDQDKIGKNRESILKHALNR